MAAVPESSWNNTANAAGGPAPATAPIPYNNGRPAAAAAGADQRMEVDSWSRAGRQLANSREIYTRALHRICLKFTTSEDEDEGKPEPATAYWSMYGRTTTIGNAGSTSPTPDSICRRMDDSMTGPSAGILSRLVDADGEQATLHALQSGMTTGWYIRGDRGDAAIRVGKAKVFSSNKGEGAGRDASILSLDADRWVLCKGASFAAGNSVFNVEEYTEAKQKLTIHCSKGPMRGKLIDIHATRCPYVFGRAHEADLCIMDRELSRRHGAILYLPNRNGKNNRAKGPGPFVLVDLESTVRSIACHVRIPLFNQLTCVIS